MDDKKIVAELVWCNGSKEPIMRMTIARFLVDQGKEKSRIAFRNKKEYGMYSLNEINHAYRTGETNDL